MADQNGALREFVGRGRRRHALLCTDSVVVTRVTNGALNRATHQYSPTSTQIYAGPARIKRPMRAVDRTLDDRAVEATRPVMDLPWGATGADALKVGDVVTVTSNDPALDGRALNIVAADWGTTVTAHRYTIEDVDR